MTESSNYEAPNWLTDHMAHFDTPEVFIRLDDHENFHFELGRVPRRPGPFNRDANRQNFVEMHFLYDNNYSADDFSEHIPPTVSLYHIYVAMPHYPIYYAALESYNPAERAAQARHLEMLTIRRTQEQLKRETFLPGHPLEIFM